jgi:hypothetical protein
LNLSLALEYDLLQPSYGQTHGFSPKKTNIIFLIIAENKTGNTKPFEIHENIEKLLEIF